LVAKANGVPAEFAVLTPGQSETPIEPYSDLHVTLSHLSPAMHPSCIPLNVKVCQPERTHEMCRGTTVAISVRRRREVVDGLGSDRHRREVGCHPLPAA
jgi:hypothetical protein